MNVAPSLISLAGAVVNVAPGKACKSVHIDPDLIKVRMVHVPDMSCRRASSMRWSAVICLLSST